MSSNLQNLLNNESQPTVFNKLLEPVLEKIDEQEQQLPRHHNQTYNYSDFFRTLIFYCTTDIQSLRLFINTYLNKGLLPSALELRLVSYTTFGEAFERFPIFLFPQRFSTFINHFKIQSHS